MKKGVNILIISILTFYISFNLNAQEQTNKSFLQNLFELNQLNDGKILQRSNNVVDKRSKSDITIQNINKNIKLAAILKAKGKSEEEINLFFNSQRVVVGNGSISGIVFESNGITPIQNFCRIVAYNEYGKYMGSGYTNDYKNGRYSITDLPSGKYYVKTSSDIYADEYYDNVLDWRNATLVEVLDGQETDGINFTLQKYEGAISGNVSDINGNPIVDCIVFAQSQNNMQLFGNSGLTDINGNYVVEGLLSGDYLICAEYFMDDKNYASKWYDDAENQNDATSILVVEPDTTKNINFVLEYGGTIMGKVLEPSGSPVHAYEATVIVYDIQENYIGSTGTDENGDFVISKLSNGNYKLKVMYDGMNNYVEANYYLDHWYDGATDFNDAVPINVTISDTTKNIIINLHEGGKISGKVFDYNGHLINDNCEIKAYFENQNQAAQSANVSKGIYTIDKLPTGRYKLYAMYIGYTQPIGREPASEWYDGVHEFDNAAFVEVTAPNETQNIDFTLERGGYISGKVFNESGQPLEYSGQVYAYNLNYEMIGSSGIQNEGMYFITGLPSGEYKLRVCYSGDEDYSDEWYNNKSTFETATILSVNAPSKISNINFNLKKQGTIRGFLTDINGNYLSNKDHVLQVLCYDAVTGEYINFVNNSFNSGYQIKLPAQDYKISVVSYNSNLMPENDNDSLAATFYENGISFNDQNSKTITLESSATLTLNDFVMEKASGSISGTIYNSDNNEPITEGIYFVFVFDEDGYLSTASYLNLTNQIDGKYFTYGLRPGNYYVLAISMDEFESLISLWYGGITEEINLNTFTPKPTIPQNAVLVTVTEGETSGIDFYFPLTDIGEDEEIEMVYEFELRQNYPNPYNPSTTISYSIPSQSHVTLKIFDILGREVETLVNKQQSQGNYEVSFDASNLTSGVYFYRIQAGKFVDSKKMLLLR